MLDTDSASQKFYRCIMPNACTDTLYAWTTQHDVVVLCSALAQTRCMRERHNTTPRRHAGFFWVLWNSRTKKGGFWEIQNNSQNPEPKKSRTQKMAPVWLLKHKQNTWGSSCPRHFSIMGNTIYTFLADRKRYLSLSLIFSHSLPPF
jgi:hypothetical protein